MTTIRAGGSGRVVQIATATPTGVATVSFTDIPATFRMLRLVVLGVSNNTTNRQPLIRISTNNGSSYASSGYDGFIRVSTPNDVQVTNNFGLTGALAADGDTSSIFALIFGYNGGTYPQCVYNASCQTSTRSAFGSIAYTGSSSAINAIQVLWSDTGNFDAGTVTLYGIT